MLMQTHYLFSIGIIKYLEKRNNISLINKKRFTYGNIKPDVDFKLKNLDHSLIGARKHIKRELDNINNSKLSKKEFSESLGVINHFICDSFCAYHNRDDLIKENLLKHFLYEQKIHEKLKIRENLNKYKNKILIADSDDMLTIFDEIYANYSNKKVKPGRDLRFALKTSIYVNEYLLKNRKHQLEMLDTRGGSHHEKDFTIYSTNRAGA